MFIYRGIPVATAIARPAPGGLPFPAPRAGELVSTPEQIALRRRLEEISVKYDAAIKALEEARSLAEGGNLTPLMAKARALKGQAESEKQTVTAQAALIPETTMRP